MDTQNHSKRNGTEKSNTLMTIQTIPTCNDCNEELTNFEIFLERKYPRNRGYYVCSKCQEVRDKKIIKELADSFSDLSFYDFKKK